MRVIVVVGLAPATRPRPVRVARKEMMYRRVHGQDGWDLRRIFPAHLPRWRMQGNFREAGTISCTSHPSPQLWCRYRQIACHHLWVALMGAASDLCGSLQRPWRGEMGECWARRRDGLIRASAERCRRCSLSSRGRNYSTPLHWWDASKWNCS
jgi:hypothetical protein